MGNCLLRELKVVVNNNNVPKFKELRLPITSGNGNLRIIVGSTSTEVMSGLNGLEFASGDGAFNTVNTISPAISGTLCIPEKDKITSFIAHDTLSTSDPKKLAIEDSSVFKYLPSLRELIITYKNFNVASFGTTSIVTLELYPYDSESAIMGDLSELTPHMYNGVTPILTLKGDLSNFTGNLSSLEPLTNCNVSIDPTANINGSLHYLGKNTCIGTFTKNAMTYTGTRPAGSYFISTGGDGIKFATKTDVENFLIDNATFDFSHAATERPTVYNRLFINCGGVSYADLSSAAQTAIANIKAKTLGSGHVIVKLNGVEVL